ncbi:MAG: hypothetical protein AB8E82_02670 [Aureispira sp.]
MKTIALLFLISKIALSQTSFSLKKEGGSLIVINKPMHYVIKEDTISDMIRINKSEKYTHYYFRRTKLNSNKCHILLCSRISPIFYSIYHTPISKRDSLIYANLKERFAFPRLSEVQLIDYKISSLQYTSKGYGYVDIFKTTHRKNYKRYVTSMKRVLVIDGIEYRISVYTKGYSHNKTVCRSRKAVCHVFEELVNSLLVE